MRTTRIFKVPSGRQRRRLRMPRALGMLLATVWLLTAFGGFIVAAAQPAAAQEAEETQPTQITISEEPGVCTELGRFCERLMEWTGNEQFAETTAWLIGTPLKIAVLILLAGFVNRLAARGIKRVVSGLKDSRVTAGLVSDRSAGRGEQRAKTIGTLLRSGASMLIFGIAGVLILENLGISIMPLLASLGIAGLAVGFGAQTLIEDLISGMMLVLEDQLGIGDDVDVGVVDGTVERLTLRSTVILDSDGVRWYVPNSEIKRVANESQHNSRAKVKIGVSRSADLPRALQSFRSAAVELAAEEEWHTAAVGEIPVPFVAELSDDAVVVEVHVPIGSTQRRALERALRQRLLDAAAASNIDLPHQQHNVWLRTEEAAVAPS